MSETIGFAIQGPGMVADYHRQAIAANAELGARLVAVSHYNPARFAEVGAKFGVPCLSQGDMLAHPAVDVVCICTPSGQHPAQAVAAAQAGKHVLVEKPMALSLADADAMIAACHRAGVNLGVVLQRRAEPLFRRVYDAIQAGDLGDLTLGVVTVPYHRPQAYYDQADWRGTWALDGGVLMNQGIHLVDLLVWYMGDPVEVQAHADTLHRDIEVEDTLVATLRFDNGALATVTATTTAAPGYPHRIEVYGTGGGVQIEGEATGRWELADPAKATVEPPQVRAPAQAGAGSDPRGIAPTGHVAIFRDFIVALRENRAPQVDGAEGRRSLATVLAVYRAAGLSCE
jgi:UDP-N-acetyl-2-amino-2-deoxyglucuronate dehydrogenase